VVAVGSFRSTSKLEDAAELYQKGGNIYKANKQGKAAGSAYRDAARVFRRLGNTHDAATALVDAGNLAKEADPQMAIESFTEAADLFMEIGRFVIAAKHIQTVAELQEARGDQSIDSAIEAYEKAADFFRGENQRSAANKCSLKVATLASNAGNYEKGAQIFEDLGRYSSENQLLKYSAKDYYFKGVVCHFAWKGGITAEENMVRYIELFPPFEGSREQKLLVKLIEAFNNSDTDAYEEAVKEYDSVSRLDDWLVKHLLIAKKRINMPGEDIN
jgi:alpha-soluble NSF attachment protein